MNLKQLKRAVDTWLNCAEQGRVDPNCELMIVLRVGEQRIEIPLTDATPVLVKREGGELTNRIVLATDWKHMP